MCQKGKIIMGKLQTLIAFTTSLQAFVNIIAKSNVTDNDIAHLCELDEEVKENCKVVRNLLKGVPPEVSPVPVTELTGPSINMQELLDALREFKPAGPTVPQRVTEPVTDQAETEATETEAETEESTDDQPTVMPKESEEFPGYYYTKYPDTLVDRAGSVLSKSSNGKWKERKIKKKNGGGCKVNVGHGENVKYVSLARIVLETFVGEDPERPNPWHKDGDFTNCHLENLEWSDRFQWLMNGVTTKNRKSNKAKKSKAKKTTPEVEAEPVVEAEIEVKTEGEAGEEPVEVIAPTEPTVEYSIKGGLEIKNPSTTPAPLDYLCLTKDINGTREKCKVLINNGITAADNNAAIVLTYMMEGMSSTGDIRKAMYRDFGKPLYITNNFITRLVNRIIYRDEIAKLFD